MQVPIKQCPKNAASGKRLLFILVIVMAMAGLGKAQEIRENENGEKIIVYPDGSYRYFNQQDLSAGNDYPVFSETVDPRDVPIDLTEEDVRRISQRRTQLARDAKKIAFARADKARQQRLAIEQELQRAQSRGVDPPELEHLQIRFQNALETEKETTREAYLAEQEFMDAESFGARGNLVQEYQRMQVDRAAQVELPNAGQLDRSFFSNNALVGIDFRQRSFLTPTMTHPPEKTCHYDFEGPDPKTNRPRRDLEKTFLFSHTDDRLRLYLKDKEYLTCKGYLSSVDGGFRFLTLEFIFAYPNAREAYGFIEDGSMLTIILLNGQYLNLRSDQMVRGSYDTRREELIYRVNYPIDASLLSTLKNTEVERFRVYWSSGYEEYEVYNLDFFRHQLSCLDRS